MWVWPNSGSGLVECQFWETASPFPFLANNATNLSLTVSYTPFPSFSCAPQLHLSWPLPFWMSLGGWYESFSQGQWWSCSWNRGFNFLCSSNDSEPSTERICAVCNFTLVWWMNRNVNSGGWWLKAGRWTYKNTGQLADLLDSWLLHADNTCGKQPFPLWHTAPTIMTKISFPWFYSLSL